jgi:DNA ligase-1
MLASPVDLDKVKYPVLCSPKFDGIRCVIKGGVALSRKLKPIPNTHIQSLLAECPDGLDGELILPNKTFQATTSAVMSEDGEPNITFYVFDIIEDGPYSERVQHLKAIDLPKVCKKVIPVIIRNKEDLLEYEREAVEDYEFEGIMIRTPDGPYKFGRSTPKQGYLSKLKRFQDSEGIIVGFEELQHNRNTLEEDAIGHAKRSHKKAGMVAAGVLGAFVLRDGDKEFKVATGLTAEQRADFWEKRPELMGKLVKYKYQESGAKDLPRFPVFLGLRDPRDL